MIPADVLRLIPGCENGQAPLGIAPLPGGRGCNAVLRVDTAQGRFVWRRRFQPADRPGSRALDELRAQQLAAGAGLAPPVLAAHHLGHWLVMEYIDAPVWTVEQLHTDAGAARLGEQLARLHGLALPTDWSPVDAVAMADDYLAQLVQVDVAEARELTPLRDRIAGLGRRLSSVGMPCVLNHGDLTVGNMLGSSPVLVDWEYSQIAEPVWDLACLLTYYPDMSRFLPRLLASSGLGATPRTLLETQLERFALLNRLWERLAARQGG